MRNFAIFVIIVVLLVAAGAVWFKVSTGQKSTQADYRTFVIETGASLAETSKKLKREGLIKNSLAFQILAAKAGLSKKIQAGSFKLSPHLPAWQIAEVLTLGTFDTWVTIPEGLRIEEVAEILNAKLGTDKGKFLKIAKEGFMFPDTYLIPRKTEASDIGQMMMDNFEKRLDKDIGQEILKTGLTLDQVIILASIVEREVKFANDRPVVAGILLKRLKAGINLGADATVQYAQGYSELEKSWWRKILTDADLEIDSPYNTRKFAGLPPGPICNPGSASIKAVGTPKTSDFFYYLSDSQGKMHYAKTLEEHAANIRNYL